jgi:hypothetical protein
MSALINDLKKLSGKDIGFGIIWFLGAIAPGFLMVFHFCPEVASTYDFLKLMLLSSSLSIPVVALNLTILAGLSRTEETTLEETWLSGSIASILSIFPSLYAAYYFKLNFPTFVLVAGAIDVTLVLLFSFLDRESSREQSKP